MRASVARGEERDGVTTAGDGSGAQASGAATAARSGSNHGRLPAAQLGGQTSVESDDLVDGLRIAEIAEQRVKLGHHVGALRRIERTAYHADVRLQQPQRGGQALGIDVRCMRRRGTRAARTGAGMSAWFGWLRRFAEAQPTE